MPPQAPEILCIGSVHWDVIGRCDGPLAIGSDRPGRICRQPGGVAFNLASALVRQDLRVALLGAVGDDDPGKALINACAAAGIDPGFLHRAEGLVTDSYMAIEAAGGLVAAIADTGTLDAAGGAILDALADGRIGRSGAPWRGPAVVDGNLSEGLLAEIAAGPLLDAADLRLVAASDGKAARLAALAAHPRATLYLNLAEASALLGSVLPDAPAAARALTRTGWRVAVVTNGASAAAVATGDACIAAEPPRVRARQVTGAGDALVAAHIAADLRGMPPEDALRTAVAAAAAHVAAPALPPNPEPRP